jgi:hypothetical protein
MVQGAARGAGREVLKGRVGGARQVGNGGVGGVGHVIQPELSRHALVLFLSEMGVRGGRMRVGPEGLCVMVLQECQELYKSGTRVAQEWYKSVARVQQECPESVTRVLSEFCKSIARNNLLEIGGCGSASFASVTSRLYSVTERSPKGGAGQQCL